MLVDALLNTEHIEPSASNAPRIVTGYDSTDFVISKSKKLQKDISLLPPQRALDEVDESVLYRLLSDISILDQTVREAILGGKDEGYATRERALAMASNIVVAKPPKAILRILIPPLAGRQFSGSYNIYWKLKTVLNQYAHEHEIEHISEGKLVLLYKKYAKRIDACYTCDCDNWEMKRVTNAIAETLNYSDNAEHFSMMYTAVKSQVDCVEATVLRMESFPFFFDYLTESVPTMMLSDPRQTD